MGDNEGVASQEVFEKADYSKLKAEAGQNEEGTMEYLNLGLEIDTVTDTEEYYPTSVKSRRGRRKKSEMKSQLQASVLKSSYSTSELRLQPKYRPIRPKPYLPNLAGRSKALSASPAVNVSTFNPGSQFFATTSIPCKDKIQDLSLSNSNAKISNYAKSTNGSIADATASAKGGNSNKSVTGNLPVVAGRKDLHTAKTQGRNSKGSIELFFESMAQTVINLPMHVQAEIKMEICKLVTMAEIKYSSSQSKQNYKSC